MKKIELTPEQKNELFEATKTVAKYHSIYLEQNDLMDVKNCIEPLPVNPIEGIVDFYYDVGLRNDYANWQYNQNS